MLHVNVIANAGCGAYATNQVVAHKKLCNVREIYEFTISVLLCLNYPYDRNQGYRYLNGLPSI